MPGTSLIQPQPRLQRIQLAAHSRHRRADLGHLPQGPLAVAERAGTGVLRVTGRCHNRLPNLYYPAHPRGAILATGTHRGCRPRVLAVQSADLASYIEGLRARQRNSAAADASWQSHARALAAPIAALLAAEFAAERVLLFGSVGRGEAHDGSDIDLLVAGIPPARWFEACDAAARLAGKFPVDLVPWEVCRPWVRERAMAEGEVLHG